MLWDCWSVHKSEAMRDYLKSKHRHLLYNYVPAGCTGKAQVLDISVNKPFKNGMRNAAMGFFADQVAVQLEAGAAAGKVKLDTSMASIKPHLPGWIAEGINNVSTEAISRGWQVAGTDQAWDPTFRLKAFKAHRDGKLFKSAADGSVDLAPNMQAFAADEPAVPDDAIVDDDDADEDLPLYQLGRRRAQQLAATQQQEAAAVGEADAAEQEGVMLEDLLEDSDDDCVPAVMH